MRSPQRWIRQRPRHRPRWSHRRRSQLCLRRPLLHLGSLLLRCSGNQLPAGSSLVRLSKLAARADPQLISRETPSCANTDEASATACFAYRAAAIALGPGITTTAASTTAASTAASTPATTSAQTTTRAGTTSAGTTAAPTQTRATGGAATLGVGMGVVLALVGGVALA